MQQSDELAERDPLHDLTRAISEHSEFDAAAATYVENVIAWRERLGLFNRVGTNLAFHLINYALYFHLASKAGTVAHGATYSNILEVSAKKQLCGGRALRSTLVLLGVMGQLKTERSHSDGRVQVYVPTEKLINEARDIYGYSMSVLDALAPGSDYAGQMHRDPAFIARLVSKIGRVIVEDGLLITEHFPHLHNIILKAGGLPTSISLAGAEMAGDAFPSTHEIARSFKISPTQVRSIIAALAECELITRAGDGTIVDASRLAVEHKGLIAREIALHAKYALDLESYFLRSSHTSIVDA